MANIDINVTGNSEERLAKILSNAEKIDREVKKIPKAFSASRDSVESFAKSMDKAHFHINKLNMQLRYMQNYGDHLVHTFERLKFTIMTIGGALGIGAALRRFSEDMFDANAELEKSIATFRASLKDMTGGQTDAAMKYLYKRSLESPYSFQDLASETKGIALLSKGFNNQFKRLENYMEILAAFDPAQGLKGAGIALREALSGDYKSLYQRFELPRSVFNKFKNMGLEPVKVIEKVFQEVGLSDEILTRMRDTYSGRMNMIVGMFKHMSLEAGTSGFSSVSKFVFQLSEQLKNLVKPGTDVSESIRNISVSISRLMESFMRGMQIPKFFDNLDIYVNKIGKSFDRQTIRMNNFFELFNKWGEKVNDVNGNPMSGMMRLIDEATKAWHAFFTGVKAGFQTFFYTIKMVTDALKPFATALSAVSEKVFGIKLFEENEYFFIKFLGFWATLTILIKSSGILTFLLNVSTAFTKLQGHFSIFSNSLKHLSMNFKYLVLEVMSLKNALAGLLAFREIKIQTYLPVDQQLAKRPSLMFKHPSLEQYWMGSKELRVPRFVFQTSGLDHIKAKGNSPFFFPEGLVKKVNSNVSGQYRSPYYLMEYQENIKKTIESINTKTFVKENKLSWFDKLLNKIQLGGDGDPLIKEYNKIRMNMSRSPIKNIDEAKDIIALKESDKKIAAIKYNSNYNKLQELQSKISPLQRLINQLFTPIGKIMDAQSGGEAVLKEKEILRKAMSAKKASESKIKELSDMIAKRDKLFEEAIEENMKAKFKDTFTKEMADLDSQLNAAGLDMIKNEEDILKTQKELDDIFKQKEIISKDVLQSSKSIIDLEKQIDILQSQKREVLYNTEKVLLDLNYITQEDIKQAEIDKRLNESLMKFEKEISDIKVKQIANLQNNILYSEQLKDLESGSLKLMKERENLQKIQEYSQKNYNKDYSPFLKEEKIKALGKFAKVNKIDINLADDSAAELLAELYLSEEEIASIEKEVEAAEKKQLKMAERSSRIDQISKVLLQNDLENEKLLSKKLDIIKSEVIIQNKISNLSKILNKEMAESFKNFKLNANEVSYINKISKEFNKLINVKDLTGFDNIINKISEYSKTFGDYFSKVEIFRNEQINIIDAQKSKLSEQLSAESALHETKLENAKITISQLNASEALAKEMLKEFDEVSNTMNEIDKEIGFKKQELTNKIAKERNIIAEGLHEEYPAFRQNQLADKQALKFEEKVPGIYDKKIQTETAKQEDLIERKLKFSKVETFWTKLGTVLSKIMHIVMLLTVAFHTLYGAFTGFMDGFKNKSGVFQTFLLTVAGGLTALLKESLLLGVATAVGLAIATFVSGIPGAILVFLGGLTSVLVASPFISKFTDALYNGVKKWVLGEKQDTKFQKFSSFNFIDDGASRKFLDHMQAAGSYADSKLTALENLKDDWRSVLNNTSSELYKFKEEISRINYEIDSISFGSELQKNIDKINQKEVFGEESINDWMATDFSKATKGNARFEEINKVVQTKLKESENAYTLYKKLPKANQDKDVLRQKELAYRAALIQADIMNKDFVETKLGGDVKGGKVGIDISTLGKKLQYATAIAQEINQRITSDDSIGKGKLSDFDPVKKIEAENLNMLRGSYKGLETLLLNPHPFQQMTEGQLAATQVQDIINQKKIQAAARSEADLKKIKGVKQVSFEDIISGKNTSTIGKTIKDARSAMWVDLENGVTGKNIDIQLTNLIKKLKSENESKDLMKYYKAIDNLSINIANKQKEVLVDQYGKKEGALNPFMSDVISNPKFMTEAAKFKREQLIASDLDKKLGLKSNIATLEEKKKLKGTSSVDISNYNKEIAKAEGEIKAIDRSLATFKTFNIDEVQKRLSQQDINDYIRAEATKRGLNAASAEDIVRLNTEKKNLEEAFGTTEEFLKAIYEVLANDSNKTPEEIKKKIEDIEKKGIVVQKQTSTKDLVDDIAKQKQTKAEKAAEEAMKKAENQATPNMNKKFIELLNSALESSGIMEKNSKKTKEEKLSSFFKSVGGYFAGSEAWAGTMDQKVPEIAKRVPPEGNPKPGFSGMLEFMTKGTYYAGKSIGDSVAEKTGKIIQDSSKYASQDPKRQAFYDSFFKNEDKKQESLSTLEKFLNMFGTGNVDKLVEDKKPTKLENKTEKDREKLINISSNQSSVANSTTGSNSGVDLRRETSDLKEASEEATTSLKEFGTELENTLTTLNDTLKDVIKQLKSSGSKSVGGSPMTTKSGHTVTAQQKASNVFFTED